MSDDFEMLTNINEVTITDIDIKFWSMVSLMIKFAFATIPAFLIGMLFYAMGIIFVGIVFGG